MDDPEQIGDADDTKGMVYWYYVLAGRMDAADAWNAAVAWNGDETRLDSTAEGQCVSATIATVDPQGRLACWPGCRHGPRPARPRHCRS